MTAAIMSRLLTAAELEAKGDRTRILAAVDRSARRMFGPLTTEVFPISLGAGTYVAVWTPYATFRLDVSERIRKMEPLTTVTFSPNFRITVLPDKIDGPDIVKVVVERDGKINAAG